MPRIIRLDGELEHVVNALATIEGVPPTEIVRRAVLQRYERPQHRTRVDESARRMMARWREVLDRLDS